MPAPFPTRERSRSTSEFISYTGKSGNTLTGVTRGVNGTTAAPHPAGATVTLTTSITPTATATRTPTTTPNRPVDSGCAIVRADDGDGFASLLLLLPPALLIRKRRRPS